MISDQYIGKISEDWRWREAELRELDEKLIRKYASDIDRKSSIVLTYSHWEGHFKYCAENLFEFISECVKRKACKWTEIDVIVRQRILLCRYRKSNVANMTEDNFINLLERLHDDRYFDFLSVKHLIVLTDSNLNTMRATAICKNLGVNPDYFLTKRIIIDQRILEHRNAIAHGSRKLDTGDEFDLQSDEMKNGLIEMRGLIRSTKDHFCNAITQKEFMKSNI